MRLSTLLLLVTLVAGSSAELLCSQKELSAISQCYITWMAGYNITMQDRKLPEYWSFHDVRMDWLNREGLNAQPTICDLGNALVSCLKPYSCLSAPQYEFLGTNNLTESNDYWIDLAVTTYQCGAGYSILMSDFYCIGTARDAHQKDLDACSNAVESNVLKHGPCRAEQTLMNCQSDVFTKACDWNAGVFFCNNILVGISAVQPECYNEGKVSCPNPRPSLLDILRSPALRV